MSVNSDNKNFFKIVFTLNWVGGKVEGGKALKTFKKVQGLIMCNYSLVKGCFTEEGVLKLVLYTAITKLQGKKLRWGKPVK